MIGGEETQFFAPPDLFGSSSGVPAADRLLAVAGSASSIATVPDARAAGSADPVASMTLADKGASSAWNGVTSAAKDAGGALGTFLRDPKNDAMLVGGIGALLAVQAVPGLDVGVDAALGIVGAAMYASAGPEHRKNITKALGKLKD